MCSFSDLKDCNEDVHKSVQDFCTATSRQSVKVNDLEEGCSEAYKWLKSKGVDVVYKDAIE